MSRLELRKIGKTFGDVRALDAVDLDINPGEILGLTGPSGAGKTTTCRVVAGIESPTEGRVVIDDQVVNTQSPQQRGVSFMFESYALYPHFTVFDNITFPLRAPGQKGRYSADELRRRVSEMANLVEIAGLEGRFPSELSGGQKQRVALCRALIQEPAAYLLDEPISHLDAKLRHKLRGEIRRRQVQLSVPTVWTSPDALEALSVSDRVAVMVHGRIHQVSSPREVYLHPATLDVARLVGDPATNLLSGQIETEGGRMVFRHPALRLPLEESFRQKLQANGDGRDIILGVRPTEIGILEGAPAEEGQQGEVYVYEPFGKYGILSVRLGEDIIKVKTPKQRDFRVGEKVNLDFGQAELLAFDPERGRAIV